MVKGMLMKKSIRDMQKSMSQFISIFIMATLAVSIVTGLDSIWKTVQDHAVAMYSSTNLSDLWVTVTNPSETEIWGISRIKGVETVEKRFTINATADLKGSPTLHVYALPDQNTLDTPKLQEGKFVSRGGAVLDTTFAHAHGLKIGDEISVKINDKWLSFPIEGLALSSEQIYSVNGTTSLMPNPEKYGFLVINGDGLESAYGQKIYNQISLKLVPNTDIDVVESEIDRVIGDHLIGIITRDDNTSVDNVNAKIQQFKTLGTVFPMMFFLVTALITQSTMMRLVENQRNQIGILKALGYSKNNILWHYTSYGVYVGLLGALFGVLIGPNVFGRILVPSLKLTFSDYRLSINYHNFILSTLLILLCTGGVSFYACMKLQGDTPAVLLRDKPPKEGSHIFLEYLPTLWKKMKFSNKLIARNTLKNKMRMIMSVLGIMGCTGLIVAAFTISGMISGIAENMYQSTYTYDQKVVLDSKADSRYLHNIMLDGVTQEMEEQAVEILCPDGTRSMEPIMILPQDSPLVHLNDVNGNQVRLPQDGITMTRKLAETLHVKQGDSILLKPTDKGYISVPIKQIIYMASGQSFYMTDSYWESLGKDFMPTSLLVKWNHQPDETFLNGDYVKDYVDRSSQQADFASNTKVVSVAVVMLIVMGAILAFVVLYNSSILNFAERTRDLATLKVLGFYQEEIRSLVLMENILSVALGVVFGVPVGKLISNMVASGFDKQMDLIGHITLSIVALSAVTTFIFALIINIIVAKKMEKVDMLQALKSVE